jgi:CRISPR-associated endonuclease Cas2
MPKKESTLVNALLFSLYAAGEVLSIFFASPYEWRRRALYGTSYSGYKGTVYQIKKRGLIEIVEKNGRKFLRLTKKGELEVLLAKAKLPVTGKWDGKWRMVVFDIPEVAKLQRNRLRDLLKKNNFKKLQESVYINPHPLNREAVKYLQETALINYIRIIKVEEMDNDKDLKQKFGLR